MCVRSVAARLALRTGGWVGGKGKGEVDLLGVRKSRFPCRGSEGKPYPDQLEPDACEDGVSKPAWGSDGGASGRVGVRRPDAPGVPGGWCRFRGVRAIGGRGGCPRGGGGRGGRFMRLCAVVGVPCCVALLGCTGRGRILRPIRAESCPSRTRRGRSEEPLFGGK